MAHLLIVTLGPIQDFIAAARRTRDLWFGSWMLSELSKATAQSIARECGFESLVFPGVSEPGELGRESATSVANKIVVRVPAGKDPAAVAQRGEAGMRARLEELRDQAFDSIDPLFFEERPAKAQVADLIEFSWVSAPARGEEDYAEARRRAESLLSARKNTRLWSPVTWGSEAPKSSIDGERESVLHEDLFEKVKNGEISAEQMRKRYGVGPTERLCAVGLLKRHGVRKSIRHGHRFLSTGHLAAWPLYHRTKNLIDPALAAAWSLYLETLRQGGVDLHDQEIIQGPGWRHPILGVYDGSLLFENRLAELFKEVADTGHREEDLRAARNALSEVLRQVDAGTPIPYYAILVADGDHMGKAIERQDSFPAHQGLSQALDRFAQSVRTIVEGDHGGELVYAGGDDVLAFVPLHRAVACAQALANKFREQLSGFPISKKGEPIRTPTLSAGIGISHFMDPLRGALHLARKAEKLAKEKRDSLAVIVDKRSGPPVEVKGIWGTLDERLKDYVTLHRADQVPDGAAYELRELGRLLDGTDSGDEENLKKLVRKEAERILQRKQPKHGEQEKIDPHVLGRLLKDLDTSSIPQVADRLIVARLLAQAADEAGEPLNPESGGPQ